MKFNLRLLVSDLCAAGAAALVSALFIAGCASGERTGKFWDKGDVKSSDAYVTAEMAKDQSFAANNNPAPSTNGKIAAVSGTQDHNTGRVAVPDFPDPPPAPQGAFGLEANATATSPARVDAGRASAGGAAAASAQTASAAAGGAQAVGTSATGSIVAPYVQKRAPSGSIDNSRHESEIVKPKPLFAKQLDPFAETDAEPFLASPSSVKRPAPPAPLVNSAPATVSVVAAPATARATLSNGNPFAENSSGPPVVSTKANTNQGPVELVPAEQTTAPPVPAAAAVPPAGADAFDPSAAPPVPIAATSPVGAPTVPSQSAPASVPIATVVAAPAGLVAPKSAALAPPSRPHAGIRLGDEDLDETEQGPPRTDESQVVQPAATQLAPDARASVAASPYEADTHHETDSRACVTPPPAPVGHPASATPHAAPSPAQDAWESTKASTPATPPSRQSTPVPANVTAVAPASVEPAHAQQASAPPAAAIAPVSGSAVPLSAAPAKAAIERENVAPPKVHVAEPKRSVGSDPMICDSVSVHGRYTGNDGQPLVSPTQNSFDATPLKPREVTRPAAPANSATPAAKKAKAAIEGKSTSFWDDAMSSPPPKHTVSTADFSVPAAPGPLQPDDAQSIGLSATPSAQSASADPAHAPSRSGSRAWFVIGMVAGLAASTVVWRRWHHNSESQDG